MWDRFKLIKNKFWFSTHPRRCMELSQNLQQHAIRNESKAAILVTNRSTGGLIQTCCGFTCICTTQLFRSNSRAEFYNARRRRTGRWGAWWLRHAHTHTKAKGARIFCSCEWLSRLVARREPLAPHQRDHRHVRETPKHVCGASGSQLPVYVECAGAVSFSGSECALVPKVRAGTVLDDLPSVNCCCCCCFCQHGVDRTFVR